MKNKTLYLSVDVIGENDFHDTVIESLNESNKQIIYSVKDDLLSQFLDNSEGKEAEDFVKVELSSAKTNSGNTKLIEFYIESIEMEERENSAIKKYKVSM